MLMAITTFMKWITLKKFILYNPNKRTIYNYNIRYRITNSSIIWEKIEINFGKILTTFGCNLPPISKYWLNIDFF